MWNSRKAWGLMLTGALTAGVLAGCGGGGDNGEASPSSPAASGSASASSGEKVKLRFMTWDSGGTLGPYQRAIDEFVKQHPNYEVKVESVPDNYDQKLLTSLASNTAPDVFMAWNFPMYTPGGGLEPLEPYIERDKWDMGMYYDIIVNYMKYDDKIWGLPTTFSTRAIYYNKKLFDDAGVPYPKDGWTWSEFTDTVKKLTKPGQYGFISTADDIFTMQPYFWSNGGDLVSDDGRHTDGVFNTEQNAKTIQFLKGLYDASSKINSAGKFSTNNGLESFETGRIAMFDNGMWPVNDIVKAGKIDLGIVTHPVPEGGTLKGIVHTSGYSMPKNGKNKDAAWELIKFMSGPEGSKIITADKFSFSPVKAVDEASGYANDPLLKPFAEELKNSDKIIAGNRYEKWSQAEDMLKSAIQAIFVNGADVKSTIDKAAKDAEKVLK